MTTITLALALAAPAADAAPGPHARLAQQLNRGLAATPMRGLGYILEAEGRRYGVHPGFVAAVAAVETSYGAAMCLPFNAWGISSCGRAWRAPTFRSWRDGIRYASRFLAERWLRRGVSSPWAIGRTYCPPCGDRWGDRVAWFMRRLGFPAPSARYPR